MAAAIGVGLKVEEPEGRMIVDIGGGTTEIAVISLGGIVINRSIRTAGDELDEAIITFARMKYNLVIGQPTAEDVKINIGSAFEFESGAKPKKQANKKKNKSEEEVVTEVIDESKKGPKFSVVRGRDLATGLPKSVRLSSVEVREALSPVVRIILGGILDTLEETPPELVADILDHGIVMAGGTSQLRGIDKLIAEESKMPVWVAEDPQMAVVRGAAKALESPELLAKVRVVSDIQ
jgi:rod shape-determining protein MreB